MSFTESQTNIIISDLCNMITSLTKRSRTALDMLAEHDRFHETAPYAQAHSTALQAADNLVEFIAAQQIADHPDLSTAGDSNE